MNGAGVVTVALSKATRAGYRCSVAALLIFFGCQNLQTAIADGETRTISFHHTHTKEDLTVTYKVNGRYDEAALKKINHVMRDWRENQTIEMDPHAIDLLWEVHRETGSQSPISIVCGYRSPGTNEMLRRRSSGVAQHSQHTQGRAIDFFIPGVSTDALRAAGLRAQRGGVGYYPSSGFVHLDTGSVRHWPRMPEAQIAAVLAKGQLASRNASDDGAVKPTLVAQSERSGLSAFFGKLFGGGSDETQDAAPAAAAPAPAQIARASAAPRAAEKPVVVAAAEKPAAAATPPAKPKPATYQVASATSKPVILPAAAVTEAPSTATSQAVKTQTYQVAAAGTQPVRPAQAASLFARANQPPETSANDVIAQRGYWQGLPAAEDATTTVARTTPASRRGAEQETTASVAPWPLPERDNRAAAGTLAYAAQPDAAPLRGAPMGSARNAPISPDTTTVAAKRTDDMSTSALARPGGPNLVRVGDRFNDPWMRALMITPSAQSFMRTTLYGAQDFSTIGTLMQKPASAVAMGFADDPNPGLITYRFTGNPVTFTPTVSFSAKTAALR